MPRRLSFRLLLYVLALASMTFALQALAAPAAAASSMSCECDTDSDCPKDYVCSKSHPCGDYPEGTCLYAPIASTQ